MPGAIITIDQNRPGPSVSSGSPGVARNDIWQSWLVTLLDGAGGNQSWEWQLLYIPPGSAVTLAGADAQGVAHTSSTTFTPDLHGTYRIRLITNGGGPGNIQILVIRVRFDNTGALIYHGWALPAFGEQDGESNYNGNLVAWAEVFDYIFADIQTRLTTIEGLTFSGDLSGNLTSQNVVGIRGATAPPLPLVGDVGKVIIVTGAGAYGLGVGFTAAHDLSGTATSQTVVGLQGRALASTAPTDGQAIVWINSGLNWAPASPAGDVTGKITALVVGKIQGNVVKTGTPSDGQALVWVTANTDWEYISPAGDVTGKIGALTVGKIQGVAVSNTAPTDGQVLQYNNSATQWQPTTKSPHRIYGVAQTVSTTQSTGPLIVSYFEFDPSVFPANGRTIKLKCVIQCSSGTDTCQLALVDDTDTVTIHQFTSTLTTPDYQNVTLTTGSPGANVIANSEKRYYVSLQRSGGSSGDAVTVHNCYLEVSYS